MRTYTLYRFKLINCCSWTCPIKMKYWWHWYIWMCFQHTIWEKSNRTYTDVKRRPATTIVYHSILNCWSFVWCMCSCVRSMKWRRRRRRCKRRRKKRSTTIMQKTRRPLVCSHAKKNTTNGVLHYVLSFFLWSELKSYGGVHD
jgi:hypothetical protein